MRDDERLGQVGEVLHVADDSLRERDPEHDEPGPRRAALVVDRGQPGREPGGDDEPDEDHDQVGVQPRDGARVEAEPVRLVGVAGVRPGPGDDRAEHEHRGPGGDGDPGEVGGQGGDERTRRTGRLVAGEPEVGGHRHQPHRHQEVRGHDGGVEAEQHGDPTEHGLPDDATQHQPGSDLHRSPRRGAPDDDHGGQREHQQHPGEGAVAELDVLVEALGLLDGRGDRAVGALGPGGAAQAAAGDPHQPAGHDDADLGHEVGQQDRGQPAGPAAGGRRNGGDGGARARHGTRLRRGRRRRSGGQSLQRKNRRASAPPTRPQTTSTAHCAHGQPPSTNARAHGVAERP